MFCGHPTFTIRIFYTYFYGIVGLCLSAKHLRKHLGETPTSNISTDDANSYQNFMFVHDLKIIAASMGLVQYFCLVIGCITHNPGLFLPHLAGQLILVSAKLFHILLSLPLIKIKTFAGLAHKIISLNLMIFNCLQEFCVFRQYLCICDL
ncbi:uncharacterized protein LOC119189120 [Manduca sexta]|nr:uncharacterized protein LOC119189120 [Manduca sexta]